MLTYPGGSIQQHCGGPHGEVKTACREKEREKEGERERGGPGAHVLIRVRVWSFWAKAGFVNSNQKSEVLVSSRGVLSTGCSKGRLWEAWRMFITGAVKGVLSGTYIYSWVCSCYVGHVGTLGRG